MKSPFIFYLALLIFLKDLSYSKAINSCDPLQFKITKNFTPLTMVGNPFKFFYSYNEATKLSVGALPVFSTADIDYL
jgi:hypothetical protein